MHSETTAVQTMQEVSALLAVPNSRIIAGGTSVSALSGEDLHLVDIGALEGLDGIKQKGTRIELGPLTNLQTIGSSMLLKAYAPALAEAAAAVSPDPVREQGTLGGNLADARIGDTGPALLATGAKLVIKTDCDFREILIDRFWPVSGGNDLNYDEWITRITIPVPKEPLWGDAFGRIGTWDAENTPAAAAAVRLTLNEKNTVTSVRGGLRLGAAHIRRMFPLEKALKNRPFTDENTEKAVKAMTGAVSGLIPEKDFTEFLRGLLARAFSMASERRSL